MGDASSALLAHSLLVLAAQAQTLDSVPLDLSRQFVDLRELYSWRSLALYGHNVSVGVEGHGNDDAPRGSSARARI
jgi:hypothetical protein